MASTSSSSSSSQPAPANPSPPPPPPTTTTTASADPSRPSPQSASFEPSEHAKAYLVNDPQRTGFDPQTSWWMNYFRILSGQMTKEGMHHYREWRYKEHEARDCAACERHRDYLFRYSPIIRFMADKVEALNGKLDASNVLCRRCPGIITEDGAVVRKGGGFDPNYGILICANEVRNRKHLEDTLAHEMVHAYDHLRWKVDYSGKNLRHAACMEIRASMLSGECRWTREAITRGHWTLTQQFQNCVRMRAIQSVMARPHCKDDVQATKVVNEVWDSCFADTRPFDEVYK